MRSDRNEPQVAAQQAGRPLELLAAEIAQPKVLLADDEAVIRTVMSSMLRRLGYEVILARDGREALGIYSQRCGEIELVIFDLMLPDMTGWQLYSGLRQINPALRALLITGSAESQLTEELRLDGLSGVLPKPFDIAGLRRALTEAAAA